MDKNSIKNNGVVYLWDLPSDKVYVELRKAFHKKISSMIKNKAEFCRVSNLSYSVIKKFIYGISAISLRDLKKIILILGRAPQEPFLL